MILAYKLRLDFCLHLRLNIQKHPSVKGIQEENKQTNNMLMGWIKGTCCAFMCLYSKESKCLPHPLLSLSRRVF